MLRVGIPGITRSGWISRAIVARRPWWIQVLCGAAGVAFAALVRMAIDGGANGVPFATFVPVIVLASIFLDTFFAALVAAGSVAIVTWLFMAPWYEKVDLPRAAFFASYVITSVCLLFFGAKLRAAIREVEGQAEQLRTFNAELRHRMRNTLQLVQSIARSTARNTHPDGFVEALSGRLHALSTANELLGNGAMGTTDFSELIRTAIGPFGAARFAVSGPACRLPEDSGVPLMLAMHELCTNAHKHGALSRPEGRITINWTVRSGNPRLCELHWQESGGPEVCEPTREGLGTRILQPQRGMVRVETWYEPDGLRCHLAVQVS